MTNRFKSINDFITTYKYCPFCNNKLKLSFDTILSFDDYPESSKNFINFNFKKKSSILSFELKIKNFKEKFPIKLDCFSNQIGFNLKKSFPIKKIIFNHLPFLYLNCTKRNCYKYYVCTSILKESKFKINNFKVDFESFCYNKFLIQTNDKTMKIFSNSDSQPIIIPKIDLKNTNKLFKVISTAITFG